MAFRYSRRFSIGSADQAGNASRAAATARSRSSGVASGACAMTCSFAGLTTSKVADPVSSLPPISMRKSVSNFIFLSRSSISLQLERLAEHVKPEL